MIELRRLTDSGLKAFEEWVNSKVGGPPPPELLNSDDMAVVVDGWVIDPSRTFASRYEMGCYLCECFGRDGWMQFLSSDFDAIWAWLAVVWFEQLSANGVRSLEHYIVRRKGARGSLAYRHAVRTSYELVAIHGENSKICLDRPVATHGEFTEQLTSRQGIAHNRGFFAEAYFLYYRDGALRRGAASKPAPPGKRKPGDKKGFGGARRLALALRRLDLTYDTAELAPTAMAGLLPAEFAKWRTADAEGKTRGRGGLLRRFLGARGQSDG